MSRVKVACPIKCGWVGDYSELQSHLINSSNHTGSETSSRQHQGEEAHTAGSAADYQTGTKGQVIDHRRMARVLRQQAQEKFNSQSFSDSLSLYSRAIEHYISHITGYEKTDNIGRKESDVRELSKLFAERANVHLVLGNNSKALQDVLDGVSHDTENSRCWTAGIRTLLSAGELEACASFTKFIPSNLSENKDSALKKLVQEIKDLSFYYSKLVDLLFSPNFITERSKLSKKTIQNLLTLSSVLSSKSSNFKFLLLEAKCNIEFGSLTKGIRLGLSALKKSSNKLSQLDIQEKDLVQKLETLGLKDNSKVEENEKLEKQKRSRTLNDLDVYVAIADGHLYSLEFQEALKFLKRCLQLDPDFSPAKASFK